MSTTTVTSAAIVGIVLVAAVISGVLGLHFWRKRVERSQAKALPEPEPQPIGPPLPTPLAPEAAAISPQEQQQQQCYPQNASSPPPPPEMAGVPRVPVPTPMYIQAARRSRSTHLVSPDAASPVSPVSPASATSFPPVYPSAGTAPPSSVPLPDSTRTSLYLSEKDIEAGIASTGEEEDNRRSSSGSGGVRGFIRRMASVKHAESRVDEEVANEKTKDMV
ncbi:uncharacterized protein J3D65DRAFT_663666 [Phyllosticta citribraziliensis]|uniref:Uncharacterized protein n=1 Tax=Phyllosticta citribraziliensis TaxID=989973 RepID=A0ABR1MAB9_9PEZI